MSEEMLHDNFIVDEDEEMDEIIEDEDGEDEDEDGEDEDEDEEGLE
ncbi:MAG: hypothetical protein RJA61_493 [Candidatus Parcubacteria bacterium]|jgi:hypothetical protein